MAYLGDADRARVWRGLMRWWSGLREAMALSKSDLRAAVDATDTFINDNETAFNNALPQAAKDNLTQAQKTFLFCAVSLARVSIPMLRRIFGEVD